MSVLINMKMPKEGTVYVIDSGGQVWSNEWPTRGYIRLDGVKAVPVPPHGRLIDADAFIKQKTELICENCIFADEPLDKDPCQECNRAFLAQRIKPNFVSKRKPITNADRIRFMTDAELAMILQPGCPGGVCKDCPPHDCYNCWLDWLKQEVMPMS